MIHITQFSLSTAIFTLVIAGAFFALPAQTHAITENWTSPVLPDLETETVPIEIDKKQGLEDAVVTISYHARIINEQTGAVIPPGGSVAANTPIKLEFVPHVSQDIYWFGTGGYFDSPYGEWVAGGADPGKQCQPEDYYAYDENVKGDVDFNLYATLAVDPPSKSLAGHAGLNCGSPNADGSVSCVPQTSGSHSVDFNFADTYGHFYGDVFSFHGSDDNDEVEDGDEDVVEEGDDYYELEKVCTDTGVFGTPVKSRDDDPTITLYTLPVASNQIPYPITVTAPAGSAPQAPSVSGDATACIDEEYEITMTATDPDGDNIRYGIKWDTNGSMQPVPSNGSYVSSGTSQTEGRTFTQAGNHTIQIFAEDEGGLLSEGTTHSFSVEDCSPPEEPEPVAVSCSVSPTSAYTGESVDWIASVTPTGNDYSYQWGGTDGLSGTDRTITKTYAETGIKEGNVTVTFNGDSVQVTCSNTVSVTEFDDTSVELTANPPIVRIGDPSDLIWEIGSNDPASCTLVGPGVNMTSLPTSNGSTSVPIFGESIFTLTCPEDADTARVRVLPEVQET